MKRMLTLLLLAAFILAAVLPAFAAGEKDVKTAVKGNNEFALAMYKQLAGKDGNNMFFSPYSISTALAMTYAGARGKTEQAMAKTLHFTLPQTALHPAMGALIGDLNARSKKGDYELNVANRIWIQQGLKTKPSFLELMKKYYGAGAEQLDFMANAEKARTTINSWVAKKTNDKIQNLIPKRGVTSSTRMVLTNAIYFKGNWASAFKETETRKGDFTTVSGSKVQTDMMHQRGSFPYFETTEFQALMLPYQPKNANELAMVLLLPKQSSSIAVLEKSLTAPMLEGVMSGVNQKQVDVTVPKFKMTSDFSLSDTLTKMGMGIAFGSGADFSGMGIAASISEVFHKAFVDVNEKGTEAAAATAVVMTKNGGSHTVMKVFRADRPFIFTIVDRKTGSILFMGRMMSPVAAK